MFSFDNGYARLPDRFFRRTTPTKVSEPRVVKVNEPLAEILGVDPALLASPAGAAVLSGNAIAVGSDPIALAYAGHQFGHFVPELGDGRAILLGEVIGKDGARRDIQLKGSGRTPFSRGGDGRAALGPVLREYMVSEAMAALGIPTTRALAAVTTGDTVVRDGLLNGAILVRVASSHMRVGTFQFFAARDDKEALEALTAHAIERHYPTARGALGLLEHVLDAHAVLVAKWMGVGFVHGVMNTDNTSISGETIDYGPCAFLDEYEPKKTFSSIDRNGRYAFSNQPSAALWNLARFAETLLPLIAEDEDDAAKLATERLDRFLERFEAARLEVYRAKLGLGAPDAGLVADLLERLAASHVDYTLFFRLLSKAALSPSDDAKVATLFDHPGAFHEWAQRWRKGLTADGAAGMSRVNPAYIARNHRVEEAIVAAGSGNFAPFERLVQVLARPWEDQPEAHDLAEAPRVDQRVTQTFCGT